MAFLQNDFAPSTAPVHVRHTAPKPRRPMPFVKAGPRKWLTMARLVAAAAILTGAALPGYVTFATTESFALAVLAADFAFLIAVAAWSTVWAR